MKLEINVEICHPFKCQAEIGSAGTTKRRQKIKYERNLNLTKTTTPTTFLAPKIP